MLAFIDAFDAFYTGADKLEHRTRMLAYEKAMAAVEHDNRANAKRLLPKRDLARYRRCGPPWERAFPLAVQ